MIAQGPKTKESSPQLHDEKITHFGQPVALVVAASFEQARAGAALVNVRYQKDDGEFDLSKAKVHARVPPPNQQPPDASEGEFEAAFVAAPVQLDVTYTTPHQSHAMMEPHATLAVWNGDHLTLYTSNQMLAQAQGAVAKTLQLQPTQVRVISRYVGGGFGAKLAIQADAILAAAAAKKNWGVRSSWR